MAQEKTIKVLCRNLDAQSLSGLIAFTGRFCASRRIVDDVRGIVGVAASFRGSFLIALRTFRRQTDCRYIGR